MQPTTKPPPITDNSTTTTEAPPRLSRAEFLEVLRRNVIGLRRLYNLEMREALAVSLALQFCTFYEDLINFLNNVKPLISGFAKKYK